MVCKKVNLRTFSSVCSKLNAAKNRSDWQPHRLIRFGRPQQRCIWLQSMNFQPNYFHTRVAHLRRCCMEEVAGLSRCPDCDLRVGHVGEVYERRLRAQASWWILSNIIKLETRNKDTHAHWDGVMKFTTAEQNDYYRISKDRPRPYFFFLSLRRGWAFIPYFTVFLMYNL